MANILSHYFFIQYSPDLFRSERFNVGSVLHCVSSGFYDVKIIDKQLFLKRFGTDAYPPLFEKTLAGYAERLRNFMPGKEPGEVSNFTASGANPFSLTIARQAFIASDRMVETAQEHFNKGVL